MLVRGAQSPGEALNVRGRGVQRDVDEVVLGCGVATRAMARTLE